MFVPFTETVAGPPGARVVNDIEPLKVRLSSLAVGLKPVPPGETLLADVTLAPFARLSTFPILSMPSDEAEEVLMDTAPLLLPVSLAMFVLKALRFTMLFAPRALKNVPLRLDI